MVVAPILENENARLKELNSFDVLDTLPEKDYDELTAIAAQICGTPISLVSIIDEKRQWFKSNYGLCASETPRDLAFCAHAIAEPSNIFVVEDARKDERFWDNPLVTGEPHVIFYAGIPIVTEEGFALGTLCVIDHTPRTLSLDQQTALRALSNQIMNLLKLRKSKILLEQSLDQLNHKNKDLERFAFMAAHDLKSPLIGIANLLKILSDSYGGQLGSVAQEMIALAIQSSNKLKSLIEGLLNYSRNEKMIMEDHSILNLDLLIKDMLALFSYDQGFQITLKSTLSEVCVNKTVLEQILINLITNAIKYNDKPTVDIELGVSENNKYYEFYVQDNGPGIPLEFHSRIFKIFEVLKEKDKYGNSGNGIGLATVKKIVEQSEGTINLESTVGKGTKFVFTLKK